MARARYLKPSFFTNERIGDLPPLHRLAFQGLWCQADREGLLKDRPRTLHREILPYDDCDFDAILSSLVTAGFILRFEAEGTRYIWLPSFLEHQKPHHKEPASTIPHPSMVHAWPKHDSCIPNGWPVLAPESESESESELNRNGGGVGINAESESTADPASFQLSEDGKLRWDGQQWLPR